MSGNVANLEQPKKKRSRAPSVAKPAYILMQMVDEDGSPVQFDKKLLRVVSVERSAEKVLETTEDGSVPHAFYLRVVVPVARPGQTRTKSAAA